MQAWSIVFFALGYVTAYLGLLPKAIDVITDLPSAGHKVRPGGGR
jgi:hypothetical protein